MTGETVHDRKSSQDAHAFVARKQLHKMKIALSKVSQSPPGNSFPNNPEPLISSLTSTYRPSRGGRGGTCEGTDI
jgi:hypothetical protein